MNSIELTSSQRDNLIEMCNALFPEYKSVEFGGSCDYCLDGTMVLSKYDYDNVHKHHNDWILIHWFEFCMTHLCEKILNPNPNNPNRGLADKFKDFFWKVNLFAMVSNEKVQHPIDYLYEQFKQLKQTK